MKRLVAVMGVCLLLSGCSSKSSEPEVNINRDSVKSTEISSSINDTSVNQDTTKIEVTTTEATLSEVETTVSEVETTTAVTSYIDIVYVKDVICNLLRCTSQSEVNDYLLHIETSSNFTYKPVVNKETKVSIESIGVNTENSNEYLSIVTLRQQGGISKFAVVVSFDYNRLSSIEITKF